MQMHVTKKMKNNSDSRKIYVYTHLHNENLDLDSLGQVWHSMIPSTQGSFYLAAPLFLLYALYHLIQPGYQNFSHQLCIQACALEKEVKKGRDFFFQETLSTSHNIYSYTALDKM